jgi:hypothetical protein
MVALARKLLVAARAEPPQKSLKSVGVMQKSQRFGMVGQAPQPPTAIPKKGGRLSAAFKSREETPKEGICGRNESARTATT